MKNKLFTMFFLILIFFLKSFIAKASIFEDAKKFFEEKKFEKSKFLFQKDIVFNPTNSDSYLYLAKIYDFEENEEEQEKNLNTVLVLKPDHEEALYMLITLKLEQSNFSNAKELSAKFYLVCSKFCSKKNQIEKKINDSLAQDERNN